jgi:hypothetical protein
MTSSQWESSVPLRRRRLWIVLGATVAGVVVLARFAPDQSAFYPACLFHRLTGLQCPGCGATRAAHLLLHGKWTAALQHNALFVAGLPLIAVFLGRRIRHWIAGRPARTLAFNPLWVAGALLAMAFFGIVRNLPFEVCRWLRPP